MTDGMLVAPAALTTWLFRVPPYFCIVWIVVVTGNRAFAMVETLVNAGPPHMLCWELLAGPMALRDMPA